MENRSRIGVSACLLGQPVRFDGSHKHDRYLTGTLGEYLLPKHVDESSLLQAMQAAERTASRMRA